MLNKYFDYKKVSYDYLNQELKLIDVTLSKTISSALALGDHFDTVTFSFLEFDNNRVKFQKGSKRIYVRAEIFLFERDTAP